MLREFGLFAPMFPLQDALLEGPHADKITTLIEAMLVNTDERVEQDKPVTPAFLYAALLWYVVEDLAEPKVERGMPAYDALTAAAGDAIHKQSRTVALPRRFTTPAMEIWQLQSRLVNRTGSRAFRLLEHPRFRAAYDFLLLRAKAEGGELNELADWWTAFQEADDQKQRLMVRSLGQGGGGNRRRRPRRRKPSGGQGGNRGGNNAE